ncbi:MAG: molybdenum ABC transporter ATP-binding protein [Beijerinckiaceae bacterium]|nr:molybdenum ABC transporter ATP-binding protein [Beijerinckiaceae bacterium]
MIELDAELEVKNFRLKIAFQNGKGITALFGRSGAGKTLTLSLIAGLMRPGRGTIKLDGHVLADTGRGIFVPPHKRRIGLVFQDSQLFPHLTVRQNLKFGRWFSPRGERAVEFDPVVETLGIGKLLPRYPAKLSGGEKQRVALGRALLCGPRLLLFDEPLAALDRERKLEILPLIERLRDEFAVPIVYVSHAIEEVARLANKIVVLEAGEVKAMGAPGEVFGLLGHDSAWSRFDRLSVLTLKVCGHNETYGLTELRHPAGAVWLAGPAGPAGSHARIIVKATDVVLSLQPPHHLSVRGSLTGRVGIIEKDGPLASIEVLLAGGERIHAVVTRHALDELGLTPGAPVYALIKASALDDRQIAAMQPRLI